ncbi:unnamed protein product, partial [Didymodactylos carnosus]
LQRLNGDREHSLMIIYRGQSMLREEFEGTVKSDIGDYARG